MHPANRFCGWYMLICCRRAPCLKPCGHRDILHAYHSSLASATDTMMHLAVGHDCSACGGAGAAGKLQLGGRQRRWPKVVAQKQRQRLHTQPLKTEPRT